MFQEFSVEHRNALCATLCQSYWLVTVAESDQALWATLRSSHLDRAVSGERFEFLFEIKV